MIARETVSVQLKITSATLSALEIEKRLGVKPDESWKLGDRTGVFGTVEKAHGYILLSTMLPSVPLEDHIREMIKRIAPIAVKIGEFASSAAITLVCAVQRKAIPPILFGRDDIRWLGVMGAQLDVQVTVLPDPARDALRHAASDAPKKPASGF